MILNSFFGALKFSFFEISLLSRQNSLWKCKKKEKEIWIHEPLCLFVCIISFWIRAFFCSRLHLLLLLFSMELCMSMSSHCRLLNEVFAFPAFLFKYMQTPAPLAVVNGLFSQNFFFFFFSNMSLCYGCIHKTAIIQFCLCFLIVLISTCLRCYWLALLERCCCWNWQQLLS